MRHSMLRKLTPALLLVFALVVAQFALANPAEAAHDFSGKAFAYVVRPGDTVFKIARRFRVDPFDVIVFNNLGKPDRLFPGQKLFIPKQRFAVKKFMPVKRVFPRKQRVFKKAFVYTVRPADTLFSISRRFRVNPFRIAAVNGIPNPNRIFAGQRLVIPN